MTEMVNWTPHESALWATCEMVDGILHRGEWPPYLPVRFSMQIGSDEGVIVHGGYQRT